MNRVEATVPKGGGSPIGDTARNNAKGISEESARDS